MPIPLSRAALNRRPRRLSTRFLVVLLAVATIGGVAGALVRESEPHANEGVAIAQPLVTPPIEGDDGVPAFTLPPSRVFESRRFEDWIDASRECDVSRGISTACIFMD
jgi:hypothetical protein